MLENIQALASNPVGMMLLTIIGLHVFAFFVRLARR
jgi:hypothetical protein